MILFNRNNEEVISSALTKKKDEFVQQFKHLTKQNILEKVYYEIRKKNQNNRMNQVERKITSNSNDTSSFIQSITEPKTDLKVGALVPNTSFDKEPVTTTNTTSSPMITGTITLPETKNFTKEQKCDFVLDLIKQGKTTAEIYKQLPFDGFGYSKINKLRENKNI